MKILITCLFFLLTTPSAQAEEYASDHLFERYARKDGFTTVYISEYMFSLLANLNPNEAAEDDFSKTVRGLKRIQILTVDDPALNQSINFYKELMHELPQTAYKELMVIKDKNQETKFLIKESKTGSIGELLLITGGSDNTLISIQGNIDLNTIAKLSKSLNINGMEKLDALKKQKESK